jgi:hypothetical protein
MMAGFLKSAQKLLDEMPDLSADIVVMSTSNNISYPPFFHHERSEYHILGTSAPLFD